MDTESLLCGSCERNTGRTPPPIRCIPALVAVVGVVTTILLATGCASQNALSFVDEAVPFADQQTALLEVVPLGTPREEVSARLKKAGVTFSTSGGSAPSIFYCEAWEFERGARYLLFSELLFDEQGRLQEIREPPSVLPE